MIRALRFAAAPLILATFAAMGTYHYWSRPILRCPDGHCPDPDTPEALNAIAKTVAKAPQIALEAFLLVLIACLIARATKRAFTYRYEP